MKNMIINKIQLLKYLGTEVTIEYVYESRPAYEIKENGDVKYIWEEGWIKSKAVERRIE